MLAALLFYGFLFFGLVLLPAGLIASVLAFFEFERRVWHGELPWVHPIAKLISGSRFATAVEARFPKSLAFIVRRSDPRNPWGLPATAATVVFCGGAWFFFRVWHGISSHGPLVLLDMRLHNIVPLFRTEWMTRVMLLWTQLAGGSTLAFLCAGSGLLALAARKRRLAATFVLALVGTGLVSTVLKILFNTGRPLDAIISAQQGSFPSGHMLSGTVFYGLLAALMLRNRKGPLLRATAVTLLLLVIVGIGLSRVYLGVHWPSDILGSLALALMLLSALLFFLHYAQPVRWVDTLALPGSSRVLVAAGIAGLVLAAMAAEMHSERTQILEIEAPSPTRRVNVDVLRHALPSDMGRWSEDFLGGRMEPVSLVIVGNEQEIERAFRLSGWERADLPTPVRVLQEGLAALANQPDPKGPATPAFLDGHPQGMTFEKPDLAMPSIRRRHHTRLWQTQYCVTPGCRPVWVATASFDVGLRLSEGLHIPTHRIDGALDVERDFIVSDLGLTGISQVAKVTVTAPHRGKNAAGDPFWTDGEAAVLMLP